MNHCSKKVASLLLALVTASELSGCGNPPSPDAPISSSTKLADEGNGGVSALRSGVWGADSAALTVADTSTVLKLNCASASFDQPLSPDTNGNFQATGTYHQLGGPIAQGDPREYPAIYSGQVSGDSLSITVQYTSPMSGPQTDEQTLVYGDTHQIWQACPL
jgi:uncharacterized lipoprotein YehR (DUF1307 family)